MSVGEPNGSPAGSRAVERFPVSGSGPMRVAVYYQPAATSALGIAGQEWLAGAAVRDAPWPGWTDAPAAYGFHATLKAPFRLAAGAGYEALAAEAAARARRMSPFVLPALEPVWFGGFLALRPRDGDPPADHPLRCLADEWVAVLEPWRAPSTPEEIMRRNPERLDATRRRHLKFWGYPHVFGTWRFHMTLSGPAPANLGEAERAAILERARTHFSAALAEPETVDAVALCVQPSPESPFHCERRITLGPA